MFSNFKGVNFYPSSQQYKCYAIHLHLFNFLGIGSNESSNHVQWKTLLIFLVFERVFFFQLCVNITFKQFFSLNNLSLMKLRSSLR